MDAAFLTGLWELERTRGGLPDLVIREFLFFDGDGTFFFAKYPRGEPLFFEPETRQFVSAAVAGPLLRGRWRVEGNRLLEERPDGHQEFELEELSGGRLLVKEPGSDVVYARADVESFPAPPLADDDTGTFADPRDIEALLVAGRANSAHRLAQRSLRVCERVAGAEHPNTAAYLSTLGACLIRTGESRSAIEAFARARRIYETQPGPDDAGLANVLNNLSMAYRDTKEFRAALEAATRAVRIRSALFGDDDRRTKTSLRNLGLVLADLGIEATLDDCEAMLREEPDENRFVPAFGRAADRKSYIHLMNAIRAEQARTTTGARLAEAQRRLREGVGVPAGNFSAVLKRIDRAQLGPISLATLQYVFPSFAGGVEETRRRDAALREHGIDPGATPTLADHRIRMAEAQGLSVKFVDRQFRRFAGENNLPPQRYWSVCRDPAGDDVQSLCRELFEYTDPRIPGYVFVSDTWDIEMMRALLAAGIPLPRVHGVFVFLLPPPDDEGRRAFRHFLEPLLALLRDPESLSLVFIPCEVAAVEIGDVVDLRKPAAQEWLFRFFREGDGAVCVKDVKTPIDGFDGMLPALVYPEFGGSGVTKSIGSWMRSAGVQGLVFPSARSDAAVEVDERGEVRGFRGWNFVDYRGAELVPDLSVHFDFNDWYGFIAGRQEAPVLRRTAASWEIEGAERRYHGTRRFMLQILEAQR